MNVREDTTSLEEALIALIRQFGAEAVHDASSRLTKGTRGRSKLPDWEDLFTFLEEDASRLLGGSSGKRPSNTSIAKQIASLDGHHSSESTIRRIQRKLAKDRDHYATVLAALDAASSSAWPDCSELIRTLSEGERSAEFWSELLESFEAVIADFSERFGPPPVQMTYAEIRARLQAKQAPEGFGLRGFLRE